MAVDVWIRNPSACIRECIEVGMTQIVWDYGYLVKKGIDPDKFMNLYCPSGMDYRVLVVGDPNQGAAEITRGTSWGKPLRVHPLWEYGDDLAILEQHLRESGPDELVVVTRTPIVSTGPGKKFMNLLNDLQLEYRDATIHLHGLYSWKTMFGRDFKSIDMEPRLDAQKGRVRLPNGQQVTYETAQTMPHWLAAVGFNAADLSVPRNRCMYNIESARWAAQYFKVNYKFETRRRYPLPEEGHVLVNDRIKTRMVPSRLGDKFLCDLCSLKPSCKYFRVGSVCSVPDSEASELSRFFKTRDSDTIIAGLGSLLALQTQRLEEGRRNEIEDDTIDNNVTKIVNSIFDRGVKLAKLVDPALAAAGAPKFKVALTQNHNTITAANPAALMAAVVNELESRGVTRADITPEMVKELIQVPEIDRKGAIDAVVVEKTA